MEGRSPDRPRPVGRPARHRGRDPAVFLSGPLADNVVRQFTVCRGGQDFRATQNVQLSEKFRTLGVSLASSLRVALST